MLQIVNHCNYATFEVFNLLSPVYDNTVGKYFVSRIYLI